MTNATTYGYDKVGNITSLAMKVTGSQINEQTTASFGYDVANRLTTSHSNNSKGIIPNYNYEIGYSPSGMITSKTTMLDGVENVLQYGYSRGAGVSPATDAVRNHQIRTISSGTDTTRLVWDADGQLSQMSRVDSLGEVRGSRTHLWNENGQLSMFLSDDKAGYYGYDGNGERVYKLAGYTHKDNYNAGVDTTRIYFNDAVLYVNPYFIVTPKGYTKHYYNGSNRLASVVGDINNLPDNVVKDGDISKSKGYMQNFANSDTLVNLQVDYEPNMLKPVLNKEKPQESYNLADNTYYYHGDHLGSASFITDGNGNLVEHRRYLPYGETWYEKRFNESDYSERYTFTGKEKDKESGYYYYGARYLDAMLLTSWMSVDPVIKHHESPYLYCSGNPMVMRDPDGKDAVYIAFPDYKITLGNKKYGHLGHAGVLLIDNKTGLTKYYEYGRYDTENKGLVRSVTVSNVKIGKDGKPTEASLNKVLGQLSDKAGHGGKVEGAYVESDEFTKMNDYAQSKMNENNNSDRKEYDPLFNNCGTFADDVIKQDAKAKEQAPTILDPRPVSIIEEYQNKFEKVSYDPNKE